MSRFSKKKRIQYEKDMYDERRHYDEIETAKMIGREEGLAEGIAKGIAESAKEASSNIADGANKISQTVATKADEAWNSEGTERLKENAKRFLR